MANASATVVPVASATSGAEEFLPTRTLNAANAETAAGDLAELIVDAPDIATAYTATADALARAGIRIETTDHVFVEPIAPAARSSMWPRQVLAAALEAQNRRFVDRISAEDAGTVLAAMGWPIVVDGGSAGDAWLAFLRAWLADAHANPDDPTSFAPLFTAEMIRLGAGVDLETAATADVHFGLLELLVLSAAFERVGPTARTFEFAMARPASDAVVGRLAAEGPCDSTMERYGIAPPTGPGSDAPAWMQGQAVSLVLDQAGDAVGLALTTLSHFQKVWRAAAFYFYSFVRVENTDKPSIHKPNEDEPEAFSIFTAKTGLDPEAFKGWVKDNGGPNGVREMNDDLRCAESLGIPRFTDVGSLADDVENWMVDWQVIEGMPEHAELARLCGYTTGPCNRFDRQSTQGMRLRRTGPSVAETELFVRIKEEKKSDHSAGAVEHEVPVSVRAQVDASTMPSISPGDLTSPAGLIGPGLETIVGLIQSSFKPSSRATVVVTYHEAGSWVIDTTINGVRWTGTKCGGESGTWRMDVSGGYPGLYSLTGSAVAEIDPITRAGAVTGYGETTGMATVRGDFTAQARVEGEPDNQADRVLVLSDFTGAWSGLVGDRGVGSGVSDNPLRLPALATDEACSPESR